MPRRVEHHPFCRWTKTFPPPLNLLTICGLQLQFAGLHVRSAGEVMVVFSGIVLLLGGFGDHFADRLELIGFAAIARLG